MPNNIELKAIKQLHEYLKDIPDIIDKKAFKNIRFSLDEEMRNLSDDEKNNVRKLYENEINFLNGIIKANMPKSYIAKNEEKIKEILNTNVNEKQQDIQIEEIEEVKDNTSQKSKYYMQDDSVKEKLEELEKLKSEFLDIKDLIYSNEKDFKESDLDSFETVSKLKQLSDVNIQRFNDIRGKLEPIFDFFHLASNRNFKSQQKDFIDDKWHEVLDFNYDISFEIAKEKYGKIGLTLREVDEEENKSKDNPQKIKQLEQLETELQQLMTQFGGVRKYYADREKYYEKNNLENKIIKISMVIERLEDYIDSCEWYQNVIAEKKLELIKEIQEEILQVQTEIKEPEEIVVDFEEDINLEEMEALIIQAIEPEENLTNNENQNINKSTNNVAYECIDFKKVDPQAYLDETLKNFLDKKRKIDSKQKVRLRGLMKKVYADNKKFKGDTFFEETFKLEMFSKKPKLFTGKISTQNAKVLNELIEKFENCKGELSQDEIECFTDFVLNPILANKELGKLQMIKYELNQSQSDKITNERESSMLSDIKGLVRENAIPESESHTRKKTIEREARY